MSNLLINPTSGSMGVEIHNVDLSKELSDSLFSEIREAFIEHGLIFFRDQELTPDDHLRFAKRWGKININRFFAKVEGYDQIAEVRKDPDQKINIGGAWHTDHSYDQVPAMGSILVARTLPPSGGDTLFAHMGEAYDALSDNLKKEIEGLKAFHTADHIYKADGLYAKTDMGRELRGQDMQTGATHPVVIRHPVTGRKLLYVNRAFTVNIVGRTREESLPLLTRLYAEALAADNTCRVRWEPGAVAIWDNRTTWHNALNDYQGHAREMHRITLSGEALAA